MGTDTPDKQPQRRQPAERRAAAMEATLRLLSSVPYEQILVEDIAAAAGMSRPLIYRYFGGKDQVALEALRWYGQRLLEDVRSAAVAAGSAWLAAAVHSYLDHVTGQTTRFATLLRHTWVSGAQIDSGRQEIRHQISVVLCRKLAPEGEFTLLRLLIFGWIGQVENICHEWVIVREPDREQLEHLLCELLISTLRVGAVADPRLSDAVRVIIDS